MSIFQPIRLLDPGCWYKFTYLMANSADPDQLASSEANWSGSTLFVKTGCYDESSETCLDQVSMVSKMFKPLKFDCIIMLILVMLNKLRCHSHAYFSANQITWSRLLIQIHILNDKQCRSWLVGFFRSQLICICTVCKGTVYLGSAGQGLLIVIVGEALWQINNTNHPGWSCGWVYEQQCRETYLQMCVPIKDLNQPVHPRSMIRLYCLHKEV